MISPASASTARRLNATTTVPGSSARELPLATNSSGSLRSKCPDLGLRERARHERERVERPEHQDVPVLAGEQEPRPRRAALGVVGPLHLVEYEHVAGLRCHLDGRADDRCSRVDALLARDEADALVAERGGEPAMGLLRQHAQRPCVDAASLLGEERERMVRLPRVRGAEVRDDRLGRRPPPRELETDPPLTLDRRSGLAPPVALGPARPLLAT